MSSREDKTRRVLIITFIILLCIGLLCIVWAIYKNTKEKNASVLANKAYGYSKSYLSLTSDAAEEERNSALEFLEQGKAEFSNDSFYYSQFSLYKANIYAELKDVENETKELEDIVNSAKSNNFYYHVALYRLACIYDNNRSFDKAIALYSKVWDNYKKDSPFAEASLFAAFRINYTLGNINDAENYRNLLIENFPNTNLTNFAQTVDFAQEI